MIRGKSSCWDWHNTYLIGALGLFLIIAFVTFEMHEATDYQGSTLFEQCCAGSACQWITKDEFKPFLLTVSLTLRPGMMQSTLGEWAHLAKWVREYEPRTLTYETYSYPEEGKQNELFFIEKYCSKEDFLAHKESSPFKKFKSWLAENDVVVHKIGADMRDEKLGHSTSYAKGY